jgi:asparagine synthase (glutamine-hydrolysing)
VCGFVGWVGMGHPAAVLDDIRAAGRLQRHRGPDDEGELVLAPRHGLRHLDARSGRTEVSAMERDLPYSAVIAHQRLSILDLGPTGAQPMGSADGTTWLAYNGEIYNYVELRDELESVHGYPFRGRGDTEVLLAAYERWGMQCLRRLEGMFAFAIVDRRRGVVVLARDHLGQKPLFLRPVAGGLAFASEIPAVLRVAPSPVRADREATLDFLATGRTDHRSDSMIEGVGRVDPGTAIELAGPAESDWTVHRFWTPPGAASAPIGWRLDEAAGALRTIFDRSVEWHRRSDVPVGTLLSGGTDSSAILLAQRRLAGASVDLQAVSYIGGSGATSEETWIDAVAAAARCRTAKLHLDREIWSESVTVARHQGEPMGGPAIVVHHALCRRAREAGVKVLLAGHGADELLAGYPSVLPLRIAGLLRQGSVLAASRLVAAATQGSARLALATVSQTARALAGQRRSLRGWPWLAVDTPVVRAAVTDDDRPLSVSALVRRYLRTSLPAILRWEDRNTMAASIEGRLPYLLPELVAFCLALPEELLVGPRGETKYVLRNAVDDLLPAAVRHRRVKVGLSVPVDAWAREIPDIARRLGCAAEIPGVARGWVQQRVGDLRDGRALAVRDLYAVWRLVGLDLWREALGVDASL